MNRNRGALRGLFAASTAVFCLLFAFGAKASLIHTFNQSYDGGNISIDLNVYDGQPGGRYLWEYKVTNTGYDPNPGTSNGFSGFELYLPSTIPEIADITPGAPWVVNCCSGQPVEWDMSSGNGIMPGESGIFSFTTEPRVVAINSDGWFHTWENGVQTHIITTLGMHVPLVPGLTPATVPEPGTLGLLALGMAAFGLRRRRQRTA